MVSDFLGSGGLRSTFGFEGGLDLGNDGGEGGGIVDGEIREDFAVGFNSGSFQAFDETRVGQVLVAAGSVDTLGPQTAELSFAFFRSRYSYSIALRTASLA